MLLQVFVLLSSSGCVASTPDEAAANVSALDTTKRPASVRDFGPSESEGATLLGVARAPNTHAPNTNLVAPDASLPAPTR